MHTYIYAYIHIYIHTCIHTYIYAYIHTRIYIYTYIHTLYTTHCQTPLSLLSIIWKINLQSKLISTGSFIVLTTNFLCHKRL